MKIVEFRKNDLIGNCVYCVGEIAGWPDDVADRLIAKGYAVLYGDGKPQLAGGKIPGAKDWLDKQGLDEHVAKLKKEGMWPAVLDKPVETGKPRIVELGQYQN
jgi:hypothetical protein